jgi:CheY-like chemotaxis protein
MNQGPEKGRGIAALVVDDDPLVRTVTADMLQHAGFDVEEASSADEALSKLNGDYRPGALVTDVQMPGAMNGYGLAERVHGLFPKIAIVVVSGVAAPKLGDIPPNAGFLAKPFTLEGLLQAIQEALESVQR